MIDDVMWYLCVRLGIGIQHAKQNLLSSCVGTLERKPSVETDTHRLLKTLLKSSCVHV